MPQDDIVHLNLTVERALYYAACLRLPSDSTHDQIINRIKEVLQSVELTERGSFRISDLSGGQRKRTSIALELLAKPNILFLDEPTSGLDPGLDRTMMELLHDLSKKGQTVVLVTHATNNVYECDDICFLARGGRLVYFGFPQEIIEYFKRGDFAEIYISLDNEGMAEEAEKRFRESPQYDRYIHREMRYASQNSAQQQLTRGVAPKRGNAWRQFCLISLRYLELLKNDRFNLYILLLQVPIMALLICVILFIIPSGTASFDPGNVVQCPITTKVITDKGLPDVPSPSSPPISKDCRWVRHFLQTNPHGQNYVAQHHPPGVQATLQDFILPGPGDAPKVLFLMCFVAITLGCINSTKEIVKEHHIYRRERFASIGILPYLGSKVAIQGILCLIQSISLVIIINFFDHFHQGIFFSNIFFSNIFSSGVFQVGVTIVLTSWIGMMMGLALSAGASNADRATSWMPLLLLPQVMFSGILFPLNGSGFLGISSSILGWPWALRWSMAALGSTVGLHSDKLGGDKLWDNVDTFHGVLFSTYSPDDAVQHLLFIWIVLLLMSLVLGIITAVILKLKDRSYRR